MSKKVEKRRTEIIRIVQSEGVAYVAETAELFKVTMETIRADFDQLEGSQDFERIHGGIRKKQQGKYSQHYFFHERQALNMEEKKKLCYQAVELISDGDCIYIDSGSTVIYLLNYLNRRRNLTIVTHSIGFLMRYMLDSYEPMFKEQGHRFVFIGGEVDGNIMMTYGAFLDQIVPELAYDYLLFSVDAMDMVIGGTNVDYQAYASVKSVLKHVKHKILLVDHSKFDLRATHRVIGLNEISHLITNHPINEQWINTLDQKHIPYSIQ